MARMTQRDRVIQYIKDFGSITRAEAFAELGIVELAARICELERMGYKFEKKTMYKENRYGEMIHFTRYKLKEDTN
jgi:hypothetical protein